MISSGASTSALRDKQSLVSNSLCPVPKFLGSPGSRLSRPEVSRKKMFPFVAATSMKIFKISLEDSEVFAINFTYIVDERASRDE